MKGTRPMQRHSCFEGYANGDPETERYHDEEWGLPCHDEDRLVEMFVLELFQAGLSWRCVLRKRENFRAALDGFAVERIAGYTPERIEELMGDPGIIRNRRKLEGMVNNARIVCELRKEFGSFSAYLWHFTEGQTVFEPPDVTRDELSDEVSADMRRRGMKFAGSVTVFSFLQAVGIVYSHPRDCWRFEADHAADFADLRYVDGAVRRVTAR